jgi:AraC-like DNA-binding protein
LQNNPVDRHTLGMFADACQVVAGRVEENPSASADLIRDLLARTPRTVDVRAQAVIDGMAVRMLRFAHSRGGLAGMAVAPAVGETSTVGAGVAQFGIADVLTFLEQRFADPGIRLSSAARRAALSPAYLARLLKASTGLTFLQHLRRFRVRHADQLLLTTRLSIKEIAARCGYNGPGSFDRDFRRVHGCAPSVWRAEHRTREQRTDLATFFGPGTTGG